VRRSPRLLSLLNKNVLLVATKGKVMRELLDLVAPAIAEPVELSTPSLTVTKLLIVVALLIATLAQSSLESLPPRKAALVKVTGVTV